MFAKITVFRKDERGATAIEYALLAALLAAVIAVILPLVGTTLEGSYKKVSDSFDQ